MEATIIIDRSFTPCSVYEPVKFGVCLTLSYSDGTTQSQVRKSGLAISKELLKIGAIPVISGLRKSANLEEVTFGNASGAILIPSGIAIAQIQLRFSQTWQVKKPVRSSINQALSHQIDDCSGAIAGAVSEGWGEIISEVYESVADVLIADGRWNGRVAA